MSQPKRAMLDIETLSIKKNAVITAVGVALFDAGTVASVHSWPLDYSKDTGHCEPRTVRWWMTDATITDDVRRRMLGGGTPIQDAAREIHEVLSAVDEVWANSPSFDCEILRNWYERLKAPYGCPWHFRQERDCRTMFALGRSIGADVPPEKGGHDCGADAEWQARYIINIEAKLFQRKLYA